MMRAVLQGLCLMLCLNSSVAWAQALTSGARTE